MYWKALYRNGTEIREGDLTNLTREKLHDGLPTGEFEPVPVSPATLDRTQLAQFFLCNDEDVVVHHLELPANEQSRLLYIRRWASNAFTGEMLGNFYLIGKFHPGGFVELSQVFPNGQVIEPVSPVELDFAFEHQEQLGD